MLRNNFLTRERPDYGIMTDCHKLVVGVTGTGRGAGATFVAMGLAVRLAEMAEGVTFAEGRPGGSGGKGAYGLLAVDRRFDKKRAAQNGRPGTMVNIFHKVNWALCGQDWAACDTAAEADYRTFPGKYIIVDSPQRTEDMDLMVCVTDPLPSRIMAGLETFRGIKEQTLVPVVWVMNKAGSAVSRREVENFLKIRFTHTIPLIPADIFYRAEFSCTQPVFEPGMAGTEDAFTRLAEEILMHK